MAKTVDDLKAQVDSSAKDEGVSLRYLRAAENDELLKVTPSAENSLARWIPPDSRWKFQARHARQATAHGRLQQGIPVCLTLSTANGWRRGPGGSP